MMSGGAKALAKAALMGGISLRCRPQYTIEQNGGASDLLLESLNPRGCAERTSELRL